MHIIKKHIIQNIFAILLTASIAVPSLVKFSHIFESHKHEVCTNISTTHLHEFDIDCEFYKFKIPIQTVTNCDISTLIEIPFISKKVFNYYTLLESSKFNFFEKRGPPLLM